MGSLIGFFAGGPARIQALLIGALAMALVCAGLLVYGLWWRGEAKSAQKDLAVSQAQVAVDAEAIGKCNAGVDQAKRVGDAAIAAMGGLVKQAQDDNKGRLAIAKTLEELARQKRNAGEGCDWAWDQIEKEKRKARATP